MTKRFVKPTIKWAEMAKLVPPEQKPQYIAFKTKSEEYWRRVQANPPEPPKIDWAAYQKTVPVKGLVDQFKEKYETFKVPFPKDTLTAKIDEQWKVLEPQVNKYCEEQQKIIDKAKKEIERIKALLPFEEMTMEDFKDMYPELALDPVNKPTFWPHTPDSQPVLTSPATKKADAVPTEKKDEKKK